MIIVIIISMLCVYVLRFCLFSLIEMHTAFRVCNENVEEENKPFES